MNVLVIGSGGREHTLVWKLAQSPKVTGLWCAPGNAGIGQQAQLAAVKDSDSAGLVELAKQVRADLTVVGPEAPLAAGIVDEFRNAGLRVFGPTRRAAEIESSKVFSKRLMKEQGIPTARFEEFDDPQDALAYVRSLTPPVWIKADGLAAGKGAVGAHTLEAAEATVRAMMLDRQFGDAGRRIIVEEAMQGQEATIMAFAAGEQFYLMPAAQDHKPVSDGDQGPNTGGMGCYSPVPAVTPEIEQVTSERIIAPVLQAMAAAGRPYYGILYTGLMLTPEGPKVVEFNSRFGDPEAEVILPRLESDLIDLLIPIAEGRICDEPQWDKRAAACVVMASGGYPGSYEKGKVISGVADANEMEDVVVFHAATSRQGDQFTTNGGRVLSVTGLGETLESAVGRAYDAVAKITWDGEHHRTDIAAKAFGTRR